ncbi:MAG TPA: hypothetical protein VIK09_05360 [Candidatus Humimicrobiaceae bacterium]
MATFTAQILIGTEHPYHGGINPTHFLFLSENDRPAWILTNENITGENPDIEKIVWNPTTENMFEDALFMINLYIEKDKTLIAYLKENHKKINFNTNNISIPEILDKKELEKIYQLNLDLLKKNKSLKLVVSIFADSSLKDIVKSLNGSEIKCEILK